MKLNPTLASRLNTAEKRREQDLLEGRRTKARTIASESILWDFPYSSVKRRYLTDIFGPNLVRGFAVFCNPLLAFASNIEKVSLPTRTRKRSDTVVECGFTSARIVEYSDSVDGPSTSSEVFVPEYMRSEEAFWDSTQKQRKPKVFLGEMRQSSAVYSHPEYDVLPFVLSSTSYRSGLLGFTQVITESGSYSKGASRVAMRGNWCNVDAVDSLEQSLRQWCSDNLDRFLTPCLASARTFNSFYQLAELKDLPKLVKGVVDTKEYLKNVKRDASQLIEADKKVSNAYLNKLFGFDSLVSTLKDLAKVPERTAKRMNYLLARNERFSTQRFKAKIKRREDLASLEPSYSVLVPGIGDYEIVDENITFDPHLEIRCVVNVFVHFPQVAVPELSNLKFNELIGTIPRVTDLYNLFPFTWLFDWYSGLGDYLNVVETILLDPSTVNYGLVTCIYDCSWSVTGTVRLNTWNEVFNDDGDLVSRELQDTVDIPYSLSSKMKYRTRFELSSLVGVKTANDRNGTLSSTQSTILTALASQFSKPFSTPKW